MSDKEEMVVPGHSPAAMVGGMRVSKPHHPVNLTDEHKKEKLPRRPKEFLETNSRCLVRLDDDKLGLLVNGQKVDVKDAFPAAAVRSFHEDKPHAMGKYPLSHSQPIPSYFQPKSYNEILRMPNR